MVRNCSYGLCKSDSRRQHLPFMNGVRFLHFPTNLERRKLWVEACGRKYFSIENVKRHTRICSIHFVGFNGPTHENPNPIPALSKEAKKQDAKWNKKVKLLKIEQAALLKTKCNDILQQQEIVVDCTQIAASALCSLSGNTEIGTTSFDVQQQQSTSVIHLSSNELNNPEPKRICIQNSVYLQQQEMSAELQAQIKIEKQKSTQDLPQDPVSSKIVRVYFPNPHPSLERRTPTADASSQTTEVDIRYATTQTINTSVSYASTQTINTGGLSGGPGDLLTDCQHLLSQLIRYFISGWTFRVTFKTVSLILIEGNSSNITVSINRATGAFVIYAIDKPIEADSEIYKCLGKLKDRAILEVVDLLALMNMVNKWCVCPGYNDEKHLQAFKEMPTWASEMYIRESTSSVHSLQCEQLSPGKFKCAACKKLGSKIRCKKSRIVKPKLAPYTNLKYCSKEDLILRCKELKRNEQGLGEKLRRMTEKLKRLEIEMAEKAKTPIEKLVSKISQYDCSENLKLLMGQQIEACKLSKRSSGVRWHPSIIQWCASIYNLSPPAYKAIKKSGFLKVPGVSTLNKFKNVLRYSSGFNEFACQEIGKLFAVDDEDMAEHEKEVCLVLQKRLKKSAVMQQNQTNDKNRSTSLSSETENVASELMEMNPPTSKQVLAFIVRSSCQLKFIDFAHFPTSDLNTTELTNYVLEAVSLIESVGLRVLSIAVEWGSCNPDLFNSLADGGLPCPYKFLNEAAEEERYVYLICDPSYLYKSVRKIMEKWGAVEYLKILDKWFNFMNTRRRIRESIPQPLKPSNLQLASYKRDTYTKERLDWLRNVFLPFINKWKEEFLGKHGNQNSDDEREQILQFQQLYEGIHISVHSVLEIVPYLLDIGASHVMTTYFNTTRFNRSVETVGSDHDYCTINIEYPDFSTILGNDGVPLITALNDGSQVELQLHDGSQIELQLHDASQIELLNVM